jgi:hypothetical protein
VLTPEELSRLDVTDEQLDQLELSDVTDRALIDLIHSYRAARAGFRECRDMVIDELLFHQIV